MHIPPTSVEVVEVIRVVAMRGDGSPENPERAVDFYYSKDGRLLASYDEINGPPDHFRTVQSDLRMQFAGDLHE